MADRGGYIGRNPGDSSVIVARQTFEPTGVQTDFTFSSGYDLGYLDVYLNGSRLVVASDYTATDGNTVGLTSFASNGDVLECVAYKAFNLVTINSAVGNFTVGGDLTVNGTSNLGTIAAGTSVSYATTSFGLEGSPNITVNNLDIAGLSTFASNVDVNASLDVSGVSTFASNVDVNASLDVSGVSTFSANVFVGTGITMYASSGIVSATSFYGDGSNLEGVAAAGGGETDITSCLFI